MITTQSGPLHLISSKISKGKVFSSSFSCYCELLPSYLDELALASGLAKVVVVELVPHWFMKFSRVSYKTFSDVTEIIDSAGNCQYWQSVNDNTRKFQQIKFLIKLLLFELQIWIIIVWSISEVLTLIFPELCLTILVLFSKYIF